MKNCVNVGILGYGLVSAARTFHVPLVNYEERMQLKSIATLLPDEAHQLVKGVHITTDSDEVINDPNIDLIIVALPNTLHYKFAKQALEAGKHVVVEKPLCVNASEIKELMQLARTHNRTLTQFHNRRWDAGFLTVQKLITEAACGETRLLEMNYDRWAPEVSSGWRDHDEKGSGMLYDLGVHLFDQTICLFGSPLSVTADLHSHRPQSKAVDYFNVRLEYPHHEVILRSSMLASLPAPRYRLVGTKGNYVKNGVDMQASQLNNGMLPDDPAYGHDAPAEYGTLHDGETSTTLPTERGAYETFYHQLASHLLDGTEPAVPPSDALTIVALVEAALLSHEQRRTVMASEISFLTDHKEMR